jgi:antitoxin component HigA of HigAB toxin-antitoxin module
VCAVTGVSPRTLARIRQGKQKLIQPSTAAKILAMDETCVADHGYVRSTATWKLLQELIEGGWRERDLAALLGSKSRVKKIHVGVTNVTAEKAMKVRRLYDAIQAGGIQRSPDRKAA